jgi:signal transduction histidine kinase
MADWLIILNADGTVLAVDGGAPADWIGTRLEERNDVPADVQRVTLLTRRQINESTERASIVSTTVTSTHPPVRILVIDAMPLRRTATDLRALLESTIQVMEPQARAIEVALTLDVAPDVPGTLHVDPDKIAWTLSALVGNALRFVRRGTRLRPGGSIDLRARYQPGISRVILEVRDDGIGIPGDRLSRLLQRAPEQLHASGPGLNLVLDVVGAHGGSVEVESSTQPDRSGTTIRLAIPCC